MKNLASFIGNYVAPTVTGALILTGFYMFMSAPEGDTTRTLLAVAVVLSLIPANLALIGIANLIDPPTPKTDVSEPQ